MIRVWSKLVRSRRRDTRSFRDALIIGQIICPARSADKERKIVMNEYEVAEVFEIGDAGEVIQTPKRVVLDEIGGDQGPDQQCLDDE